MTTLQDMLRRRKRAAMRARAMSKTPSSSRLPRHRPRSAKATRIRVVILSYERPAHLCRLLRDVAAQRGVHDISIAVYDDASTADYAEPKAILDHLGGEYVRVDQNHGKRGFWRWVDRIYADQRTRDEAIFVFLPDDVRLCRGFFDRALRIWTGIADPKKAALTLFRDTGRDGKPCWTDQHPQDAGSVLLTGWVDGAILCGRRYLEILDFSVRRVDPSRWRKDRTVSSGVGQQISLRLCAKGATMYGVKRSLLCHVEGPSTMNPEARRQNPLRAIGYIDGEDAHAALAKGESVTISLASVPRRKALLAKVVRALWPHCDRLNVYLNGYATVPDFLSRPGITVATSAEHGDRGDAGKFFWSGDIAGYHLTVDDDIAYPDDYVQRLLGRVERYGRKAIVGLHGVVLPPQITDSYYDDRKVYYCMRSVERDVAVHLLGTGTVAYHASTIRLSPSTFKRPNMADVWLGIAAKTQRVPMICVAHPKGWLLDLDDPSPQKSIGGRYHSHDHIQASALRKSGRWGPPLVAGRVPRGERPPPRRGTVIRAHLLRSNVGRHVVYEGRDDDCRATPSVRRHSGMNTGVKKVR